MHQLTSLSELMRETGEASDRPMLAAMGWTTMVTMCLAPSADSGSVDSTDRSGAWSLRTSRQNDDQSLYILSPCHVLSSCRTTRAR